MKKRILALLLVIASVATVFVGCNKPYNYDNYEQYIKLGPIEGIEINKSDIEDGIMETFRGFYNVEDDKLEEKTYSKAEDDVYVQKWDVVNITFVGKKDGVAFEGGSGTQDLTIGANQFVDNFDDGLIGYKVGDKLPLDIHFPAYYHQASLKNADTVFEVTINSIKRTTGYPEYNDENIQKKTESKYKTVAEFEEATRETVINNLIWQVFYASSTVSTYPKKELKKYYNQNIDQVQSYANMLQTTLEYYVLNYYGAKSMEAFYQTMASQAQSQVKQELLVLRFIEENPEFKMTEEKYKEEVEKLIAEQNFDGSIKKFEKQYSRSSIEMTIYYDIIIEHLKAHRTEIDDITKNGFIKDRNGVKYYENNVCRTGWCEIDPEKDGTTALYYFDDNGYAPNNTKLFVTLKDGTTKAMVTFGANGLYDKPFTGKVDEDGGTKYYDENGIMVTGRQEIDLDSEEEGKETYFFDYETGYMVKSGVVKDKTDGLYYKFDDKGIEIGVADGIVYDEAAKTTRYFKEGVLLTGWVKYDSETNKADPVTDFSEVVANTNYYYCSEETGVMVKSACVKIGDTYYVFDTETGIYKGVYTGKIDEESGTKFCNGGVVLTGWVKYNSESKATESADSYNAEDTENQYYYCNTETGVAVKSTTKVGDKYYAFNMETGVCEGHFTGTFEDKDIVEGEEQIPDPTE